MMWNVIRAEWLKIRRCQILLVGVVALALCPVAQYGSQLMMAPEYREATYDMTHLFANVIWGNSQVFLPISLVMIGGWLIDRESVNDTLKQIVSIPVPMPKLLGAKLLITGMLALLFGIYSVCVTLLTGACTGLQGLTPMLALSCGTQVVTAALTTYLVCMPLILIFGQIRGAWLTGSVFTFFLGYCILFFKGGVLSSAYPFSAALILAGFDMRQYNGATSPPDPLLALAGIASVLLLTLFLLSASGRRREMNSRPAKKAKRQRRGGGRSRQKVQNPGS